MRQIRERKRWHYLIVPALLIGLVAIIGLVSERPGDSSAVVKKSVPHALVENHGSGNVAQNGSSSVVAANQTGMAAFEPADFNGAEPSWPAPEKRSPQTCSECDPPSIYEHTAAQLLAQQRENERTESKVDSESLANVDGSDQKTGALVALKAITSQQMVIREAVDMGFTYKPTSEAAILDIKNSTTNPSVTISMHGPGTAQAVIDGQPVESGRPYLLQGDTQIQSSQPLKIDIRTNKNGVSTLPDSNG